MFGACFCKRTQTRTASTEKSYVDAWTQRQIVYVQLVQECLQVTIISPTLGQLKLENWSFKKKHVSSPTMFHFYNWKHMGTSFLTESFKTKNWSSLQLPPSNRSHGPFQSFFVLPCSPPLWTHRLRLFPGRAWRHKFCETALGRGPTHLNMSVICPALVIAVWLT